MKFEYNGRIYSPSNLEKKLKKLGITIDDIKIIIDTPLKEKEIKEEESELRKVVVRSNQDDIRRICYIPKDSPLPTIRELFKKQMWNPETKTGIKELTEEFLMTMYYEE